MSEKQLLQLEMLAGEVREIRRLLEMELAARFPRRFERVAGQFRERPF